MEQDQISVGSAARAVLPFSEAITANNMLYISGQVGNAPGRGKLANESFEAEANQAMLNIGTVLQRFGIGYADLVLVTIYLTDMENYGVTNEVYRRYFQLAFPARVCIAVKQLPMDARIEIAAVAKLAVNNT